MRFRVKYANRSPEPALCFNSVRLVFFFSYFHFFFRLLSSSLISFQIYTQKKSVSWRFPLSFFTVCLEMKIKQMFYDGRFIFAAKQMFRY